MKKICCGLVACVLASVPIAASAADATPPPPPMVTKAPTAPLSVPAANMDWSGFYLGINGGVLDVGSSGAVVGGTLGYNFQTGAAVLGIEGDLDAVFPNGAGDTGALGTIRGRAGYTFGGFMPYITAGYAQGTAAASGSGLAIGGGAEFRLTPTMTFKAEYLRLDLDVPDNMVRAGLNWRFSPGAPIVARF